MNRLLIILLASLAVGCAQHRPTPARVEAPPTAPAPERPASPACTEPELVYSPEYNRFVPNRPLTSDEKRHFLRLRVREKDIERWTKLFIDDGHTPEEAEYKARQIVGPSW